MLALMVVSAQPIKDADNDFRTCKYESALDLYKKGMSKISKNKIEVQRVTFQIAECYRIMGDLKKAEQQYLRLEKKNYQKTKPIILFHLGSIYNLRGEYDQALKYYNAYKKREAEDTRVDVRIEGCQLAKGWMENPTRYEVENFKKFNTKSDEWAPRWGNPEKQNELIFTSNREGSIGKGTDQWTGVPFSDLYKSEKPKSKNTEWPGEWSPVTPVDEAEIVNTAVNEGEASANRKGSVIYLTKCPQDKKKVQGCYIYTANKKGNSWSEPALVELSSDSIYNYVHPFISDDELTIYFASNRPGGYGGYDIYKATRAKKSGKFTNITNLGANVNTAGQEVFPTFRGTDELYFSSDGLPGMGGLDIFVSRLKDGEFQPAENMQVPINSCWDEIGMIFDESEVLDPKSKSLYLAKGFFSSNRPGGRGGDDIYYFLLRPLVYSLAGFVKDEATLQYIDGATVELTGSDGTSYKTTTDVKGYYYFDKSKILGNTTYSIEVKKPKYWEENNTATQTTVGLAENTNLKQDFKLTPIPIEPIVLPEILFDLARWDLKKQYEDSIMALYRVMTKNPTLVVELRSHTDYRDTDEKNEILSQNRAQTCVDFLISKGIDPERIVAKGYGEYRPRKFTAPYTQLYLGKKYSYTAGTELTESYITSMPKGDQEAANALNRRTEFIILRTDFVPKTDSSLASRPRQITVIKQKTLPVTINGETVSGSCFANNKSFEFQLAPNSAEIFMSYTDATKFLKDMIITFDDFEAKDKAIKPEDGSILENSVLFLSELRVGDDYSENVKVIIKKGLPSNFVIGDKYITDEWGNHTLDKEKKLLIFSK
jgi:peptidoglycan-associated lipoprotein